LLSDYHFVNSIEVYYEDGSSIRSFPEEWNCTLPITSYFHNYIYENIYISQQKHQKKEQKRKRKKNEKKLLKG
jgi:hypothetical protein